MCGSGQYEPSYRPPDEEYLHKPYPVHHGHGYRYAHTPPPPLLGDFRRPEQVGELYSPPPQSQGHYIPSPQSQGHYRRRHRPQPPPQLPHPHSVPGVYAVPGQWRHGPESLVPYEYTPANKPPPEGRMPSPAVKRSNNVYPVGASGEGAPGSHPGEFERSQGPPSQEYPLNCELSKETYETVFTSTVPRTEQQIKEIDAYNGNNDRVHKHNNDDSHTARHGKLQH